MITKKLDNYWLSGEWEVRRESIEDKEENGEEEEDKEPDGDCVADEGLGDKDVEHPLNTPFLKYLKLK